MNSNISSRLNASAYPAGKKKKFFRMNLTKHISAAGVAMRSISPGALRKVRHKKIGLPLCKKRSVSFFN
jgi:hypothetical protein